VHGLIGLLRQRRRLLNELSPDDRVAVVTFGSHLELTLDFTGDRELLDRALEKGVLFGPPDWTGPDAAFEGPSLRHTLDERIAENIASPDQALAWLGEALAPLPGAKAVVLVGHGFGLSGSEDYARALTAFERARAAVFALDVTDADRHWFEQSLQHLSDQTGGWFARAFELPGSVLERVGGALAGSYALMVEEPPGKPAGRHDLEVSLTSLKGTVYARTSYRSRVGRGEPE
jgi:hypothetical protein